MLLMIDILYIKSLKSEKL